MVRFLQRIGSLPAHGTGCTLVRHPVSLLLGLPLVESVRVSKAYVNRDQERISFGKGRWF
jgi:hydroxymethylpyrimidine/phosphomethylpyrimidine kinase